MTNFSVINRQYSLLCSKNTHMKGAEGLH